MKLIQKQGASVFDPQQTNQKDLSDRTSASVARSLQLAVTNRFDLGLLDLLVDVGSHMRMGGLVYANWYFNEKKSGRTLQEDLTFETGKSVSDFLLTEKVLEKKENGIIWVEGEPPAIDSELFIKLVLKFSETDLPRFLKLRRFIELSQLGQVFG